jgi:hypothetical protein
MIEIVFQPGHGLMHGKQNVHTKFRTDKLHFFQVGNNIISNDFVDKDLDELLEDKSGNFVYLGYTHLKQNV